MNETQPRLPPQLPAPGGPARAALLLVRPGRLFLYWVKDDAFEKTVTSATGPAEVRLEMSAEGGTFVELDRQELDLRDP